MKSLLQCLIVVSDPYYCDHVIPAC
jgi:hypothetical protein